MQTWMLMMWSLVRTAVRGSAPLALLVGVCAGNVGVAHGDIQPVEPFYVAVAGGAAGAEAELRCREGDISYIVAKLKPGTVLIGDGRGDGWIRVLYPAGLHAVVNASEVTYDGVNNKVTLTTPSRLRAMELGGGPRSHWWHLLDENLPAGESFTVVEVLKRPEGQVEKYRIVAPKGAHGYLRTEAVREATSEEIARLGVALPAGGASQTTVAATPRQPGSAPSQPATEPSGSGTETAAAPGATAAPSTPVAVVTPAPMDEDPLMARVDALAEVFNEVQKQPIREAEFEPAIAEFEQAIATLTDSEIDQVLKGFLQTRLELLKLRQEVRAQILAIHSAAETLDAEAARVEKLVNDLTNAGRYVVVGRLTPSTVYDGRRLPLMYRVESVGPGLSRTLAYLEPKTGEDFAPMLGRIVGVVGVIEQDEDRNIKFVRHSVVDLIKEAAPAAAPSDAPAAAAGPETAAVDSQGSD